MRQALIDLGYKDCYHFNALLTENPPDQKMWIEAIEAKHLGKGKPFDRQDWDQLLGHCQAVTDTPCVMFYKELLEAYPDAKIVITKRDSAEQWHRSQMNTIVPWVANFVRAPSNPFQRALQYFTPVDSGSYYLTLLMIEHFPMFQTLWYDLNNGTKTGKDWYTNYLQELEDTTPAEKRLIMNVEEGWEPLCNFLGEEVPLYPFPRVNDTETFQKHATNLGNVMQKAAVWNMCKTLGGVAVGLVAVGLGVTRWKRWV